MTMTITETSGRRKEARDPQQEQEDGRKITRMFLLFAVAIGILFVTHWYESVPPEPNYSGYYGGDWVNKRGQLVSPDGHILNENYGRQKAKTTDFSGYTSFEINGP